MSVKIAGTAAGIILAASSPAAGADSAGFLVRLTVGVHCSVKYDPAAQREVSGPGVPLGELSELCNAQHGYRVLVTYTPGSLRGARIRVGADEVILNGSGEAVLSQAPGPRVLRRAITAVPGRNGFDARSIQFRLVPA